MLYLIFPKLKINNLIMTSCSNKRILFLCLLSILFSTCFAANTISNKIPIVAWWLTPNKNYPKDQKIKDIKDCGFNTILYYDEGKPSADSICKIASRNGIDVILGAYKLKSDKAQSYINKLSSNNNIIGWYLKDEPLFKDLPALKIEYDNLIKYTNGKPIYINLIGCRSDKYTGPCPTIGEYLDTIETLFHPHIWSFDYYPISVDDGNLKVQYNQFFKSLKAFHDKSLQTGRPFWSFCETVEYKRPEIERPAATIPFLRFEAFSALAFGAKGIVYWSYELTKSRKGQFISALIDSTGRKTPAWHHAQMVNQEISAFSSIFANANINRIYIPNKNLLSKQLKADFSKPIDALVDIKTDGKGLLISDFTSNGINYLLILNLDVENPQTVKAHFLPKYQYHQLDYKTPNSIRKSKLSSSSYQKTLPPGSYTILSYTP